MEFQEIRTTWIITQEGVQVGLLWQWLQVYQRVKLRICSCLACVYRVTDARGKFGEHEKYVRVARSAAESNSSFWSALQTSQVHP